jgi:hypothetical protein
MSAMPDAPNYDDLNADFRSLSILLTEARGLAEDACLTPDRPTDRCARDLHQLRQHMAVGLILANRMCRGMGGAEFLTIDDDGDTATVSFRMDLTDRPDLPDN